MLHENNTIYAISTVKMSILYELNIILDKKDKDNVDESFYEWIDKYYQDTLIDRNVIYVYDVHRDDYYDDYDVDSNSYYDDIEDEEDSDYF